MIMFHWFQSFEFKFNLLKCWITKINRIIQFNAWIFVNVLFITILFDLHKGILGLTYLYEKQCALKEIHNGVISLDALWTYDTVSDFIQQKWITHGQVLYGHLNFWGHISTWFPYPINVKPYSLCYTDIAWVICWVVNCCKMYITDILKLLQPCLLKEC